MPVAAPPHLVATARIGLSSALTSAIAAADIVARSGDPQDLAILDRLIGLKRDVLVRGEADGPAAQIA